MIYSNFNGNITFPVVKGEINLDIFVFFMVNGEITFVVLQFFVILYTALFGWK